jgi:hypothetical protein
MKKFIIASSMAVLIAFGVQAQNTSVAFVPGQLAVLRAGNGVVDLGLKQAPIFVDQYDPNNVGNDNVSGPQLTVAIPTAGDYSTPAKSPLFFNGQAATEGAMTRSADRTVLTWAGYANPIGSSPGTPSSQPFDRGFCTIDAFTNYLLIYKGQDWYGGAVLKTNPRGIASDGTNFWGSGGTDGNELYTPGNDPFQFQSIANSTRSVKIINNTLFTSINSGDSIPFYPPGIYNFIDDSQNLFPLPDASAGLNLVIPVVASYTAINGFDINPQQTIAYVADTVGGVQKYVKAGGVWNFAYNFFIPTNILANFAPGTGCYDLTVDWSGSNAVIYATTTDGYGGNVNSNRVVQIVDTNANAAVTTIAQCYSIQEAFRGIAFTPDLRPLITSEPVSYSTVVGSNATFSVAASSVYALGYQWYTNGVKITDGGKFSGTTTNRLTISNAQLYNATTYIVVVTNNYGSVTSAPPANLTVTTTPVLPTVGAEQYLTNVFGDNIIIAANATGTDPKTYQWYTNGVLITDGGEFSGTASNSLTITGAEINDATEYEVVISNPAGTTSNVVAQVTLVYGQPAIIIQPVSTTFLQGASDSMNVKGYGPSLAYQWYSTASTVINTTNISYILVANAVTAVTNVNSVTNSVTTQLVDGVGDITGSTTSKLQFSNVALSDQNTNGGYFVVLTNYGGSITSQLATLTVAPARAMSYVNYTNSAKVYAQNFDSLPIPDGATVNTANPLTATVATSVSGKGTTATVIYSLGDSLGGTWFDFAGPIITKGQVGGLGLAGTMDGWYGWAGTAIKFGMSAGDQSTGGQISEGAAYIPPLNTPASSVTNRALGLLATSSTGQTAFGLKLINNTASILTNINLHFIAELWRQQPGSNNLNFGYYIDTATVGTNSVFNPSNSAVVWVPNLTASFQTNLLAVLDGTQPTNQTSVDTNNMQIASWSNSAALWLVWEQTDSSGSHQGLAIDNLQFSATNGLTATAKPVVTASSLALPGSAILNGTINPGGLPTSYYFQYTNAGVSGVVYTTTNVLAASPFTLPVSAQISGLNPNQTYYFSLVASNSLGVVTNTGTLSFVSPAAPALAALAASGVDQLDANFNGWINPSNAVTTYYFNWGTTTSYGNQTAPTVLSSPSAVSNNISLAISGALAPNTTYHYQLVAYNGVGGTNYSSDTNFTTTLPGGPVVKTSAATVITSTNATLNGSVNPNGQVTSYYFQYGADTGYTGGVTPTTGLPAAGTNAGATNVKFVLTGLTSLQVTHYRLVASNNGGSANGSDAVFTNLPNPPTAVTLNASNLTTSHAVFDATINPSGSTNLYWFQYGLTTSYGSVGQTNGLVAGFSTVLITNLSPSLLQGTTYHYQIITVNSGGSSSGGDMTFKTLISAPQLSGTAIGGGAFRFNFISATGLSFSVLATNNLAAPMANWPVVGQAVESPAGSGNYQYTNSSTTNALQFYILRQP